MPEKERCWFSANDYRLLTVGCWLLDYLLLAMSYWLLATGYWLPAIAYRLLTIRSKSGCKMYTFTKTTLWV